MSNTLPDTFDDQPAGKSWHEQITWGTMLALGWLIYEVTARPSFGIVVACGKFGWNDFLTAHWLLRTDPDRGRGRACFWFYVASGLWKITVAAFLLTGPILILIVVLGEKLPGGLKAVALTAAVGIGLLAVVPLIGVLYAHSSRARIWVDSTIHASRKANHWPPSAGGFNSTMGLLFPALMVPVILTALFTFPLGLWAILLSTFAEGFFLWALFRAVCARSPAECWGEPAETVDLARDRVPASLDE